jgi:hypothetical protein
MPDNVESRRRARRGKLRHIRCSDDAAAVADDTVPGRHPDLDRGVPRA